MSERYSVITITRKTSQYLHLTSLNLHHPQGLSETGKGTDCWSHFVVCVRPDTVTCLCLQERYSNTEKFGANRYLLKKKKNENPSKTNSRALMS